MHPEEELIQTFYQAFAEKDGHRMKSCYHPESIFRDEVFELKGQDEIGAMWIMLCSRAKNFSLVYSNLRVEGESGSADWEAQYTFRKTGRLVHNKIHSEFSFRDGLIARHHDEFDFWRWSRMALGLPGILFGWSGFLKNKVRKEARSSLQDYLQNNRF